MPSIVAIDLETTGLDPEKDTIIEIGAIRFNENRVEDEFSSLVNPRRPISAFISQLTGISNEMVSHAPELRPTLAELAIFVDNSIVIGHNVNFDLSFLQKRGILEENQSIDTYDLASVLLPTSTRYNLTFLAGYLTIPVEDMHRALNDARVTMRVYQKMVEKIDELPIELLAEIVRLSEPFDWQGAYPFQQALRKKSRQPVQARRGGGGLSGPLFEKLIERSAPLKANSEFTPIDIDEAAALLEHAGPFSKYFPEYEYRSQQVEMLKTVAQAFNDNGHLLVEAATGTGKSYAYLIPAALWAMKNNARVVVSTNTINLQDQLIKKDIPDLTKALGIGLKAAVMKGRNNYLCPRRFEAARLRLPGSLDELRVLAKVLTWLEEGGNGDRSEINLNGPAERDAWSKLSAEDDACKLEVCVKRNGGACPFYQAREAAQSAHIIVINHALLLADISTGSRVLPEFYYLIVDEGHHLEDATTSALSFKINQLDVDRLLREMGGSSSGVLGRYLTAIRHIAPPSDIAAQEAQVRLTTDYAFQVENLTKRFFTTIDQFLENQREGRKLGTYSQQVRITAATRVQPDWTEVEIVWDDLFNLYKQLNTNLNQIVQWIGDNFADASDELMDIQGSIGNMVRRLLEVEVNLNGLVSAPESDRIYWAELAPNGYRLSLQAAPLHIGPLMEQHMWNQKSSIIVTSATLTTGGDFGYLRGRLNAADADELAVGSPFDYETAAMLYLVNDIPEPSEGDRHQGEVSSAIIRLCKATNGRALVLFTSYAQLRKTSQSIGPALSSNGIEVYEQGEGASASTLLDNFKTADKAVLLGTRSFWEGVDIPGESLSVLVIVKLPFDVPSDPIIAARSETFEDPFNEYQLPEAILKFRQGFGRLIRTQSDRGIVVVLDKRILSKKYGKYFLESIPRCKMNIGSVVDLPKVAEKWLNK
jgi:DNA polymerase-3 subunit epsilon/ATP-dependent DNA helicase DinG